jgi:hypothetical protein
VYIKLQIRGLLSPVAFFFALKKRIALVHQLSMAMLVERFGVGEHEVPEHLAIDDHNTYIVRPSHLSGSPFNHARCVGQTLTVKLQIQKALKKQIDRLHAAVDDVGFDRHELRILVKRTRYLTEAFPKLSPLSRQAASSLKGLQSALGAWHDIINGAERCWSNLTFGSWKRLGSTAQPPCSKKQSSSL